MITFNTAIEPEVCNNLKKKFNRFYGPALLSEVLLYLSFPEMDLYPLAWVALIPLLLFIYDKDKWTAFKAGFFFGILGGSSGRNVASLVML